MKTLYIIRHAKANHMIKDCDRTLIAIGRKRTTLLGQYLSDNQCKVEKIVTSNAERALETAKIIALQLNLDEDAIVESESMYKGTHDDYISVIVGQDNELSSLMLVGHNPQITNLARFFVPDFSQYMQTNACFCIDFETDKWETVFTAERTVRFFVRPT